MTDENQTPDLQQDLNIDVDLEPPTYEPMMTPPSVHGEPIEQQQEPEQQAVVLDEEEASGTSWRMLLEFYALLDLIIFITMIVMAVVKRKQKTKLKREKQDNEDVSDIYIFIAILWFPNVVCFLLNLINGYTIKWLYVFQRWAGIRAFALCFISPVILLLLDAKEMEALVCAEVLGKDLETINSIKAKKEFSLLPSWEVDDAFDSLHLMSLPVTPEQQVRGYSLKTEEIFGEIEVQMANFTKVDGQWYRDGKKWERTKGSKGLIWTDEQVLTYELKICASAVALSSLVVNIFFVILIALQFHILNMLIGEAKLAEELIASKERRQQRLDEMEEKKLTNMRKLKKELEKALMAIRGEDEFEFDSDDDYAGNAIN